MERLDFFFLASYENRHMDPDPGIEPPPPAQRSGDDRGDGNVRPLREPPPAREAEGAAREGASEATPPPRGGSSTSGPAKRSSSAKRQ